MTDLDKMIQEALRGVVGGHELAHEPSVAEELIGTFRTRHRWLHGIAFVFTFFGFIGSVWSATRFAGAETTHEQLMWGGMCILGLLFVGLLKMYFWLEIHTNRIVREIKRVELLVLANARAQAPRG